jgi:hypothetical protein
VVFSTDPSSSGCGLASGVVKFAGIGTCVIDANQAGNTTYAAAPQVQQRFTINPAVLRVAPAAVSKTYGQPDPMFSDTIGGFVNGDTAAVVPPARWTSVLGTATVTNGSASLTTAGVTGADGVASYHPFLGIVIFVPSYTATFAGDSTYLASTATGSFDGLFTAP